MKPLWFLFVRSFLNGIKRALTNPRRLIGLVAFCGYYFWIFIRPFGGAPRSGRGAGAAMGNLGLTLPGNDVLDAVVFGFLAFFSLTMMLGVLSYKGNFRPADVDVLFPTPVSPRVVLVFRIVRDYLFTLLAPLVLAVVGWRGATVAFDVFFKKFPETARYTTTAMSVGYLLMAFAWVMVGYAVSLFVNRSDLQSDRNRRIINWTQIGLVTSVAFISAIQLRSAPDWETVQHLLHNPFIRAVFLPATMATALVMGPLTGSYLLSIAGLAGLLLIIGVALRVALSQSSWMYDQAAARGFDAINLREKQQQGDVYGLFADRVRQGKYKRGKIAAWASRQSLIGPGALIWKEMVLQARTGVGSYAFLGLTSAGIEGFFMYTARDGKMAKLAGPLFLGVLAFMVFMVCLTAAQTGFLELLRRVDFQKPLPFSPRTLVFWEIAGKSIVPIMIGLVSAIVGVAVLPRIWPYALSGLMLVGPISLVITSTVFLVVVLFPDIDDPTQRGFRGLMMLLGVAIFLLLPIGTFLGLLAATSLGPIVSAILPASIAIGISVAISFMSGAVYATFNPNE